VVTDRHIHKPTPVKTYTLAFAGRIIHVYQDNDDTHRDDIRHSTKHHSLTNAFVADSLPLLVDSS